MLTMVLSGAISTPTTSADIKPLIDLGARENQPGIPLRSVRGQFGPLSVKDMLESSSQLVRSKIDEVPQETSENSSLTESIFRHFELWKNHLILWLYSTILALFNRLQVTKETPNRNNK